MQPLPFNPDRALEAFKEADREREREQRASANTFKIEPRVSKSKLTVRIDADGRPRWYHATKGWRGLAHTAA